MGTLPPDYNESCGEGATNCRFSLQIMDRYRQEFPVEEKKRNLKTRIQDFLWFGFVPSEQEAISEIARIGHIIADPDVPSLDWNNLKALKEAWLSGLEKELVSGTSKSPKAVLGLSSGLDSRAILAGLLEIAPVDSIYTHTFGHPGTEDFDKVHDLVAKNLANHKMIEVSSGTWDLEKARHTIRSRPAGVALELSAFGTTDNGVPHPSLSRTGQVVRRFTGFMGGSISGSKLGPGPSTSWENAIATFVRRNKAYKGRLNLFQPDYRPELSLPQSALRGGGITVDDQLDWGFRQFQRIRFFVGGSEKSTPFTNPVWWKTFALAPVEERIEQNLYRRFLSTEFPDTFGDLSRKNLSRKRAQLRRFRLRRLTGKGIQGHVDMDLLLQKNEQFGQFARNAIWALRESDAAPWLPYTDIFRAIDQKTNGTGRQLYILSCLWLNIEAGHLSLGRQ